MLRIELGNTLPLATAADVTAERDRRIGGGFSFMGKVIQSRDGDRENIAGAKSLASDAIEAKAQKGDYGWQKLVSYLPNPAEHFASPWTVGRVRRSIAGSRAARSSRSSTRARMS